MKPSNFIFVAHDFSTASRNSLNAAAQIALKKNLKLFVYHVVSAAVITDAQVPYTSSIEIDVKKATTLLRRGVTYLKKKFPGLSIAFEVDYGYLIPTLQGKIEEINPLLAVFGVKKRSGLDKVIFGDVCTSMIGKLKCPTLVVPQRFKTVDFNHIVYGWDGKNLEVRPLSVLKSLIPAENSDITAVNVSHYDDTVLKNAANYRMALRKYFPDTDTSLEMVQGLDKETEFEKAVKKLHPDVLVIYAHHYNLWQSIFHKRFSRFAVRFSHCPVLVVS